MIANRIPKKLLNYVGIFLVIVLVGSLFLGSSEIFTGVGLILVIGAMLYLRQMESVSEKAVSQKIKAEYPSELQPQVFEIYKHLKVKELEGLFLKILEDSKGDVTQVKKLASVAESVGWKAFIENRW